MLKYLYNNHGGITLKQFFSKYSYRMVKLFVTQCVISLFGNVLAFASLNTESNTLMILSGALSIAFYLFLVYMSAWEAGSQDKPAIDGGRQKFSATTGLYIGIGANIPNFVLAIIYIALLPFSTHVEGVVSTICGLSKIIFMFINGMYTGILSEGVFAEGLALNSFPVMFFVIALPAIICTILAYIAGTKDFHLTRVLLPLNAEEQEIKRDQKREKEENK